MMEVLETKVDKNSEDFKKNSEHYQRMVADLKSKINMIMGGGGPDLVKLHHDRGKMLAPVRVACPRYSKLGCCAPSVGSSVSARRAIFQARWDVCIKPFMINDL